ncbi:MAG: hypothetical protein ACK587_17325 [Cyanobacteriota bacterium]
MINLRSGSAQGGERAGGLSSFQRLWLWTPIAVGGALSTVLLLALALPLGMEIDKVLRHLAELELSRVERDQLTSQNATIRKQRLQARRQKDQLIQLVAGREGDLSTFLATLDLEAEQSRVSLKLYEPLSAAGASDSGRKPPVPPLPPVNVPSAPGGRGKASASDALGKAGLRERSLVLVASGTYPELLQFLRRVEMLDVLVEQKDLSLKVEDSASGKPRELPLSHPVVEMRLSLTLWSKATPEERKKPAAAPPSASPPSPAPPG